MTTHLKTKPVDAREPAARLLRDVRTTPAGLTAREAARRLQVSGPNALPSHGGHRRPLVLLLQLIHPWRCCRGRRAGAVLKPGKVFGPRWS